MLKSYHDLQVWQASMELAELVYRVTADFPKHEEFGLRRQIRRAVVSVPSNIAEGHARGSTRECLHYLSIARGSLAELETQLILAARLGYMESKPADQCAARADEVSRMLRGLQKSLARKISQ